VIWSARRRSYLGAGASCQERKGDHYLWGNYIGATSGQSPPPHAGPQGKPGGGASGCRSLGYPLGDCGRQGSGANKTPPGCRTHVLCGRSAPHRTDVRASDAGGMRMRPAPAPAPSFPRGLGPSPSRHARAGRLPRGPMRLRMMRRGSGSPGRETRAPCCRPQPHTSPGVGPFERTPIKAPGPAKAGSDRRARSHQALFRAGRYGAKLPSW
jgi:hypothetical protein